ncbi:MAG: Fur family transcriptional regulator [Pseudomonadota bacterium]
MAKQSTDNATTRGAECRSLAEACCKAANARLTPARLAAYTALVESDRPLSAYELIAVLEKRESRKIAPLTVYRHLDFLTNVGLVHRLESTQSYVPCNHPQDQHESQYFLCSTCGAVDEVGSRRLESLLSELAEKHGFSTTSAVVEMTGVCKRCGDSVQ